MTGVRHRGSATAAQAFGFDIDDPRTTPRSPSTARRHEFGDTKYRRIIYHSVATTRFREFFPRPLDGRRRRTSSASRRRTDAGGTVKAALVHHIPSSARPAAPEPLYVLPTFRWELEDDGSSAGTCAAARRCASGCGVRGSPPATASSSAWCSSRASGCRAAGSSVHDARACPARAGTQPRRRSGRTARCARRRSRLAARRAGLEELRRSSSDWHAELFGARLGSPPPPAKERPSHARGPT